MDVGYSHDSAKVITEVIMRCGNPTERVAVEVAVSVEKVESGESFCPVEYPEAIGAVRNDQGKMNFIILCYIGLN